MFIGQCGTEKSGNYLLYRILREILTQLNEWNSYSSESHCWDSLFRINDIPLSFPELRDFDEVSIQDGSIHLHNSHLTASFTIWDLEGFRRASKLIWTHQTPRLEHYTMLGSQRRWFYILRDGRDVANSWMHYVVSQRMLRRHPQYKISKVEDIYQRYDIFRKAVERWVAHVKAYLALKSYYLEVKFEDLLKNKTAQIDRITDYLGVSNLVDKDAIIQCTSLQRTRQHAPLHLRHAAEGDWRAYFDNRHKEIFQRIAGSLLEQLAYSTTADW